MSVRIPVISLSVALMMGACDVHIDSDQPQRSGPDPTTQGSAAEISRPVFPIETDRAYDSASVAAYAGDHTEVYAHIDEFSGLINYEPTLRTYGELLRPSNLDIIIRTVSMAALAPIGGLISPESG